MQFREVAEVFEQIEGTTKRLEKTDLLARLFTKLAPDEVAPVVYLSVGRVGPQYDPLEFGLAGKMAVRTVAWGTGKTVMEVTKEYKHVGDLGTVIEKYKTNLGGHGGPDVQTVFSTLRAVAEDTGAGSQERKIERLGKLLRELDPKSAKYVVRLVLAKLRIGFSDLTILDALSWAKTSGKADREALERALNVSADMGRVAGAYMTHGIAGIQDLDVAPGVPVRPMRASRLGTVPEIVEKLVTLAVEPKFDGMRVQIHAYLNKHQVPSTKLQTGLFQEGGSEHVQVRIYSRGLEDITKMFPDVVEAARALHHTVGDFVLDGEALGIDPTTGKFLPFQETMKRKRKYDIGTTSGEIPLVVQVFDILYFDGRGCLRSTYSERRKVLEGIFGKQTKGIFQLAASTVVTTAKEAQKLFDTYIHERLEGMLCKRLDSPYQAGARNFNWVKYKRAHEADLADTIDCVVMGYYVGKGKRQQFGVGAFLAGVTGREQKIVTVAKIGTGLTDEQFRELKAKLKPYESKTMPEGYTVAKALVPDVWVTPNVIVEIQADEITKSPIHAAGYALRFPRLVQFRSDKKVEDITTVDEVIELHRLQT